jgi:hypothetical protein
VRSSGWRVADPVWLRKIPESERRGCYVVDRLWETKSLVRPNLSHGRPKY